MSDSNSGDTADGAPDSKPVRINPRQVQTVMHNGLRMPQLFDPIEVQLQKVKDMEIRNGDVLLCSYYKSGTHWLWRILDMLVSGTAEYSDTRNLGNTLLDLQLIDRVRNVDSPRVLVTHYPFDFLPDQVKAGKAKVVHVFRNPKAVLVSLFFHLQSTGRIPDLTIQKLGDSLLANQVTYRNMFYYFDRVKECENLHPHVNILHVSYEDVKQDTAGSIKKLAAHLQVKASDELCSQIAEAVSFKKQKEEEDKLETEQGDRGINLFRKGEVSDWKNYLTVAQSERFDQVLSERADTCRFSARYRP